MSVTAPEPVGSSAVDRPERRMPGLEGFWVFLAGDLAIFTLMFLAFAVARADDVAGFEAARTALDVDRGGINTLVLLTSSACVAVALTRLRTDRTAAAARWTGAGAVGGLVFVVLKTTEYAAGLSAGHTPDEHPFYTYYLTLTGLHLLHVVAGCLVLGTLWARLRRGQSVGVAGYETVACYWHLVDLLWLVIFPLVYLVR